MTEIVRTAAVFNNDLEAVKRELKRLSSAKSRLNKRPNAPGFEEQMTKLLQAEYTMQRVREYLAGTKKSYTTMSKDDIKNLSYDECVKALKSIQCKKTHTRWLTDTEGDNDEYRSACQIEAWLKEHKETIEPRKTGYIQKTDLLSRLSTLRTCGDLTAEDVINDLENYITNE